MPVPVLYLAGARTLKSIPIVAVVDDNQGVRLAIDDLLKSGGYSTSSFSTVESFLNSTALWECECVISDLHMPGMTGVDLIRTLRSKGIETPVLVVSAQSGGTQAAEASILGAFALLEKPFLPERFLDHVKAAVWRGTPHRIALGSGI